MDNVAMIVKIDVFTVWVSGIAGIPQQMSNKEKWGSYDFPFITYDIHQRRRPPSSEGRNMKQIYPVFMKRLAIALALATLMIGSLLFARGEGMLIGANALARGAGVCLERGSRRRMCLTAQATMLWGHGSPDNGSFSYAAP